MTIVQSEAGNLNGLSTNA